MKASARKSDATRKGTARARTKARALTIPAVPDAVLRNLKISAEKEGLSIAEAARQALRNGLPSDRARPRDSWVDDFRKRVLELSGGKGLELALPPRVSGGEPPDLSDH